MTSANWVIGADDFGQGQGACKGWTFFGLPENKVEYFEKEGRILLKKHGLPRFHGKKFNHKYRDAYIDFLKLIESLSAKEIKSFAAHILYDPRYLAEDAKALQKSSWLKQQKRAKRHLLRKYKNILPQSASAAYCLHKFGFQGKILINLEKDNSLQADIEKLSLEKLSHYLQNYYLSVVHPNRCLLMQAQMFWGIFIWPMYLANLALQTNARF